MFSMTKRRGSYEVQTPFIFGSTRHSGDDVKFYRIKMALLA